MEPNNYGRGRSPPFGYSQSRVPIDEFDSPMNFHPMEQYEAPINPHSVAPMHHHSMPPHLQPPYMEGPPHHEYTPEYRDQSRVHQSHRMAMPHRDPYGTSPVDHQPRAGSPPFKILCITNINHKISDAPIKEALTSDFGRFGDISVSICHDSGERLAYIYFRNYDDAREARNTRMGTMLFDRPIEIEPIYEPTNRAQPVGLPLSPGGAVVMSGQSMYSPRERSISPPPPSYPLDIDVPPSQRRAPLSRPHMPYGPPPPNHPGYPYHRGSPPPEYAHVPLHGYSYGPPTAAAMPQGPPLAYERRAFYDDGYNHYPSPHAISASSPYSTPPHEHYRPSYHPQSSAGPIVLPSSRGERERLLSAPRSPRSEAYYQIDQRAPPIPAPQHEAPHPPRRRRRGRGHRDAHKHLADAPMRFMSREYRREKFGDYGSGEHEEGKPSRVLLINNIDPTKTEMDLRETFESHGVIEDMEVKKVSPETSSAIIKFSSMDGAYKAKTANNGRFIGTTRCRIVYGKVSASRKLWVGGLSPSTTVSSLEKECGRYGYIVSLEYTPGRPYCYVEFESANQAQFAAHHLKSTLTAAPERKIRVEFVNLERSERLLPRQETSSQASETSVRSRVMEETVHETESSPNLLNNTGTMKRDISPSSDVSKRLCGPSELPYGSNTFKQERLAAAAAAKARSSSATSSHPSDRLEPNRATRESIIVNELNNNGDSVRLNNGDLDSSQTPTSCDNIAQEAPSLEKLAECTTIREVLDCCSVSWPGRLALKNTLFPAQLYLCSGSKELIDKYLTRPGEEGETQFPLLSITQRWRLHPQPKLEVVKRRMQSGNLGIFIITSRQETFRLSPNTNRLNKEQSIQVTDASQQALNESAGYNGVLHNSQATESEQGVANLTDFQGSQCSSGNSAIGSQNDSLPTQNQPHSTPNSGQGTQSKSIRNLISYLGQKDAAGVISLSAYDGSSSDTPHSVDNPPKLLYTFPPGEFALNLLQRMASNLTSEATKEEFLLGVISRGNLEGKI